MYSDHPVVRRALAPLCSGIPSHCVGVHGRLYEVAALLPHPGGNVFLKMVAGTDATALIETHHLDTQKVQRRLPPCVGTYAQVSPYDYTVYRAMRTRALRRFPTRQSRRMTRCGKSGLAMWVAFAAMAHAWTLVARDSWWWLVSCVVAAYVNAVCGGYGHNALHRLEATAVLLDWNGLSCYEWLLEHVMSHHMHVNTPYDHDAISMEPFVEWIPGRLTHSPPTWLRHFVYAVAELVVAAQGHVGHRVRWRAPREAPLWMRCAPFVFIARLASYVVVQGWCRGAATALVTLAISGYLFAALAHINHVYEGDARPCFVAHQLRNTRDLARNYGPFVLFLDRQRVHHLFPTVDHTRFI